MGDWDSHHAKMMKYQLSSLASSYFDVFAEKYLIGTQKLVSRLVMHYMATLNANNGKTMNFQTAKFAYEGVRVA